MSFRDLRQIPSGLISNDWNRFKGFRCNAGIEPVSVDASGDIDPSVYSAGIGAKKPNVFTNENPVVGSRTAVICSFEKCACLANLLLEKRHPDFELLAGSLPSREDRSLVAWLTEKGRHYKNAVCSGCFESVAYLNPNSSPAISIIVSSWRLHPDTLKNLQALEKQRDQNYQLKDAN